MDRQYYAYSTAGGHSYGSSAPFPQGLTLRLTFGWELIQVHVDVVGQVTVDGEEY
jgi:hypothetical protein